MTVIRLTKFQALEVEGLLDVIDGQNEIAECDEDRMVVWATLAGLDLTVLDHGEAVVDLEYRAEWMVREGEAWNGCALTGQSGARSLLKLAAKIEEASR